MKNKSILQRILIGMFVVLVLAASNSIVRAQCPGNSTTWIRDPSNGPGDWFDPSNWSNHCVPSQSDDAFVNDGGQAQINTPSPTGDPAVARTLTLGENQSDSGVVTVENSGVALVLPGVCSDDRLVPGDIYVGKAGSAKLVISNGATVINGHSYIGALQNPTRPNSSGSVSMSGTGTQWIMSNQCGAGLSIGTIPGNGGSGGTAGLDIRLGATLHMQSSADTPVIIVGLSGTLSGSNPPGTVSSPTIFLNGSTDMSKQINVYGTLAPSLTFGIEGNVNLLSKSNTILHVTNPGVTADGVFAYNHTGGGHMTLDGRLTVIMNGSFTPGPPSYPIMHGDADRSGQFASYSFMVKNSGQCFTPIINYDANNALLYLQPCLLSGGVNDP